MEDTLTSAANSDTEVQQGSQESTETVTQTTDSQGDNLESTTADDTTGEQSTDEGATDTGEAQSVHFDPDLDEWAEKTGRAKPETDNERKAYQEIRNQAREFGKAKQAKESLKEVSDALDVSDPTPKSDTAKAGDIETELQSLKSEVKREKTMRARSEYFQDKNVTVEEAKLMGDIIKEVANKKDFEGFNFLTNPDNIETWHMMAQARLSKVAAVRAAEQAAKVERERFAKESQAGPVNRGAKTISTTEKTEAEKQVERFSKWD